MTTHQKPHGHMSAAQLVALYADEGRHPNALSYELIRAPIASLGAIMHGTCLGDVDLVLGVLAGAEIQRRSHALRSLLADSPSLRAAVAAMAEGK